MRNINEIIVHCTATSPEFLKGKTTAERVKEVRRWHVEQNGWKDIGYHFLIDRDGTVAKGRDVSVVGAHVSGHNASTIGISLFGGNTSKPTDKFSQHFTTQQEAALRKLIADLQKQFPTIKKVTGHNQYANKACPGFNVPSWLSQAPAKTTPSTTPVAKTSFLDLIINLINKLWGK